MSTPADRRSKRLAYAGVLACLFVLVAMALPLFRPIPDLPPRLAEYYASGPTGAWGIGFFATLGIVAFLAGEWGNASRSMAALVALVVGLGMAVFALAWSASADPAVLHAMQDPWLQRHRWLVAGTTALAAIAAGGYATAVLQSSLASHSDQPKAP